MGRKIPGRKHRGVRDPEKQMEKRIADLSTKINAPPKDVDAQDIPKSLARVIKLKEAVKNKTLPMSKRKRTKKKGIKLIRVGSSKFKPTQRKGRPEKVVPVFNQRPGESEYEFLERVNRETHNFVKETEFETKFNVEIKRSSETGDIEEIVKREKDEIDELQKLVRKQQNMSPKKLKKKLNTVKLSKSQKKKEKLMKKKLAKGEDVDEFKKFTDKVEFGEVAHAPPELKIRPKKANVDQIKVNTNSLLLSSLFKAADQPKQNESTAISKSGKWKDLSPGQRLQLEKQQADAVAAYRALKSKKL